ncbi:hypothetical protein SAMCCGM7_pA0367 (plasmid) [Sinorhizobium americanum CCGM7]|nr:hypothetical protein SAMCCGM7_pA0367 [Sinorhizobium americanum CCGM7]
MKPLKLIFACALALGTTYDALAAEFTKATVKKIDCKAKKVTLHARNEEPRHACDDDGVPRRGRRHPAEA